MRLNAKKLVSAAILLLAAIACSASATAQNIPSTLNGTELEQWHQDRMVRIEYTVQEKTTAKERVVRGTGFFVASEGYALTARHVLEPALSEEYYQTSPIVAIHVKDGAPRHLMVVPEFTRLSTFGDVALFKVDSNAPLDYLCVERDESLLVLGSKVTVAAWRYYEDRSVPWLFSYHPNEMINQRHGPGNLFEYSAISQQVERSMSGGPVLRNGRVVAVISRALIDTTGHVTGDGNYAYLVRYAKDTGWDGRATQCGRPINDEIDFLPNQPPENFVSSTCEGSIAWARDGSSPGLFGFPDSGNYRMRRRELTCDTDVCKNCTGPKSPKSVRFVINHNSSAPLSCNAGPIPSELVGKRSAFGAQVVPIFRNSASLSIRPETWFYRNVRLLRRNASGQFNAVTDGPLKGRSLITPKQFTEITRSSGRNRSTSQHQCQNIPKQECDDIYAIRDFDRSVEANMQWHGYARKDAHPRSTLFGLEAREGWALTDDLLAVQNLHVKNWILRYELTQAASSPVDFAFCINSDWDGFVARSFSSERRLESNTVRIFLDD